MDGGTDGRMHVTDSDGNPNVFNVGRNDDGKQLLNANYANPDNRWNLGNEIVFRLRKSLHFSPAPLGAGEFCFSNCPRQPPSILPISLREPESAIYFLLSSDFVSHRTSSSTFIVSTLRRAKRTNGSFSCRERKPAVTAASTVSTKRASTRWPRVWRCVLGNMR